MLTRTSWDSAEADTAASFRNEAMRSGPALWGWFSCSWTWVRKVDPTPDTVPAAALRSWTARNCRPSTGRMVTGAKRGDERSDLAWLNSAWAAWSWSIELEMVASSGVRLDFTSSRLASPCWSWW